MANQKAITKAARDLGRALRECKESREAADMPAIIARFKEQVGGPEAIADILVEDFQRARGVTPEGVQQVRASEALVQKYHQMLLKAIQAKDEAVQNAGDLSHLDDEDLKATLVDVARDLIHRDETLRRELVVDVLQSDPGMIRQALVAIGIEVVDDEDQ